MKQTNEIFGEHCDRRLPGNHQSARTQTLFFHQISDHGKLAVKNEDGTSQLASATLTVRWFRLAGRHFFPFKKL